MFQKILLFSGKYLQETLFLIIFAAKMRILVVMNLT